MSVINFYCFFFGMEMENLVVPNVYELGGNRLAILQINNLAGWSNILKENKVFRVYTGLHFGGFVM